MNTDLISELQEIDWKFDSSDTQYSTHGISDYPARMIPQIPDNMFRIFTSYNLLDEESTVYDPFVGSGTTLTCAKSYNINSVGNDINPFAVYLSQVKASGFSVSKLYQCWNEIKETILPQLSLVQSNSYTDTNINEGWFPEPEFSQLLFLRSAFDELESDYSSEIVVPFRIVLATIARRCSYQRNGEFKRYRIPEEDREDHKMNIKEEYINECEDVINRLVSFSRKYSNNASVNARLEDSRQSTLESNSIDAVITSPPYGDHSTTVAYGQFSRDPSIIGFGHSKSEMLDVDKDGLGGKNTEETLSELTTLSKTLDKTLSQLRDVEGRSNDAVTFFSDYFQVLQDVYRVLKPESPVVWVVANRTMSRVQIPTHLITKELCSSIGFTHEVTLPRSIPSKTLPWENAPENETGNKGKLMADENIIVLTK